MAIRTMSLTDGGSRDGSGWIDDDTHPGMSSEEMYLMLSCLRPSYSVRAKA